jgi:NAD(P)-dependent dehydrogenase (short-subunit alcohol dehydrogenase family)
MRRFQGRTALVTGAAQGIGLAVAARLAGEGARVVLADRNAAALEAALAGLRGAGHRTMVEGEALDVTDPARVDAAVARVVRDAGSLDVLVNNAGILRDNWVDRLSDADWGAVLAVHLTGAFHCCRAAVPAMKARGYGRIVNLSSRSWMGNPGQANYSAAKAGLVGLTRALALELVRFGITVNAVAPGLIDTPMAQGLAPEVRGRLLASQPGGRMGTAAEVASAVAFLAAEEASFVTGQVLGVCGGKDLGMGGVA